MYLDSLEFLDEEREAWQPFEALDELTDFGRPKRVYLAVLVERSGRELPVQPDFVGKHVVAGPGENIEVRLVERHGTDEVVLQKRG